ncbi:histidine kinase [Microseira sp. BLCC-F43]|uniref:histidine kinase n=1 Tax=Microseira sp. BLCC-F43 TaxID=3153602 RepID=UPI0035BAB548
MPATAEKLTHPQTPLQLLLFVDERPSSTEQLQQLRHDLEQLKADYPLEFEVIDVGAQPYLAEHFKLVATPALIKISPPPRHVLAGSNLVAQLQEWWTRWKHDAIEHLTLQPDASVTTQPLLASINNFAELIQLTEEIFQLKQENEELQRLLQFKDRIISMLAHDLRNPLTAASIALETLETNYNPHNGQISRLTPALTAHLIKQARVQTRNIERLIADILQAGKGKTATLRIHPQKLNLENLCLDILNSMKPVFEAKMQQVTTDIPKDLPYVYADTERVRQVLVNLLDNAIKYTPEEGTIAISILHRTSQKVQVSVSDNGPGIPEESREHIFEDSFRLQRDQAKEGYGIGLSLCQRIILAHYGRIWVDSTPGSGSCFHFTLPVYRQN